LFEQELNPPVIQVTRPTEDEAMDTEDASAPPLSPQPTGNMSRNLNPFLNREDPPIEEVEEMDMEKSVPLFVEETNPFRKLNEEQGGTGWAVKDATD
jgi:hypothetical protein